MRAVCVFCGSSPGRRDDYDHLLRFFEHAEAEAFLHREHREALLVDASPATLLDRFMEWQPPCFR